MKVYADNAATTKISDHALRAMMPCFETYYGNPSSLHTVGQEAKEMLEDARARVAKCLGCEPREVYFTSGGSEADNQAIISAARFGARKNKKHILLVLDMICLSQSVGIWNGVIKIIWILMV